MSDINSMQKHKVKAFVKELENFKGRHTELVSVYVPAGYEISKIVAHISEEQGTASNIKSKQTRDNVTSALERMIQHLKLYKKTPTNGLVVFAGNVAEREGQQDYRVWALEPPIPLNQRLYRCDKEFVLEPLREMMEDKLVYGLVVMDKREATLAFLKGKSIIPLTSASSAVPGKHKSGGQSAMRFEKLRDLAAIEFYNRIAEYMKENFLPKLTELKGILVGGPGPTKLDFVDGGYITDQLKRKIIAVKDLSYTDEFGLTELVEKCEDVLANEEVMDEKKAMNEFFEKLAKTDLAAYGVDQVMAAIQMGAVDKLLISETMEELKIEEFEAEAAKFGTSVKLISVETREGAQLKELGRIAAILRFKVHH